MTGSLTAVLLPLALAAPALAVDGSADSTGLLTDATSTATVLTDGTAATTQAATATTDAATDTAASTATVAVGAAAVDGTAASAGTTSTSFRAAPAALAAAPSAETLAKTSMRLSAARLGADGTSRIGVRLLSGSATVAGQPVTVQAETADGWVEVRRLRTDGQGLAAAQVPFDGRTAVRAVFEGSATHAASSSPRATVLARTPSSVTVSAGTATAGAKARIGARVLADRKPVVGAAVAVEARNGDGSWRYAGQATTDRTGLAVARIAFGGDTRVRISFPGTATALPKRSAEAVVEVTAASAVGERAVQLAAQQAGKPYRYGSTGPSAFDCSGFTSYIYNTKLGKKLPRTSAAQAAALPKVAPSAKQPGDLLFFRTRGRVSHVGIYAGNGKMWAAPTRGDRVKLQSIYSSRYSVGRVV